MSTPAAAPPPLPTVRARRAFEAMRAEGLDGLIAYSRGHITQYGNVEFLTGYTPVARPLYAVLTAAGETVLVAPTPADRFFASRLPGAPSVLLAGEGDVVSGRDDLAGTAASALRRGGAQPKRVGVVGMRAVLPAGELDALRAALGEVEIVDADPLLARVKALKDERELAELQATAEIADAGFFAARRALRVGATDAEVGAAIRAEIFARGCRDALIFASAEPFFLCFSQGRSFRDGDLVSVYVEVVGPTGYWVEVGGLLALGEPPEEQLRVAETALAAAAEMERMLRPGRTAGEVARVADEHAARAGLHSGIWHGHGVGVDHDRPVITASDTSPLEPGMVLAVHPNYSTADERYGASVVDTYAIGRDGPTRLSAIPQEIVGA
ncbi:MAG: M24 family metallopeptidase [Solirubrobacteraceae bacterium]